MKLRRNFYFLFIYPIFQHQPCRVAPPASQSKEMPVSSGRDANCPFFLLLYPSTAGPNGQTIFYKLLPLKKSSMLDVQLSQFKIPPVKMTRTKHQRTGNRRLELVARDIDVLNFLMGLQRANEGRPQLRVSVETQSN